MTFPVVVFDLDGVLADTRHRDHHLNGTPKNWDAYFAAAGDDGCIHMWATLANVLALRFDLVVCTGRPERLRPVTAGWLQGFVNYDELHMRGNTDRRPNHVLKVEQARDAVGVDRILFWVDDNPAVADALAPLGVPVLTVRGERDLVDATGAV